MSLKESLEESQVRCNSTLLLHDLPDSIKLNLPSKNASYSVEFVGNGITFSMITASGEASTSARTVFFQAKSTTEF